MLKVTIEAWPGGDRARREPVGDMIIVNDGTGSQESGNYQCLFRSSRPGDSDYWARGTVQGFPREIGQPEELVQLALASLHPAGPAARLSKAGPYNYLPLEDLTGC